MVDISRTYGALLIGGVVASAFSGIVTVQFCAYFKFYPCDPVSLKLLVSVVWFLDILHTVLINISLWDHLIVHYGESSRIDLVPWSLALTVGVTAILIFFVHCFFINRIYKLSKNKIYLAVPLLALAALRLSIAFLTTTKLISYNSLSRFVVYYMWSVTAGLSLSCFVDVLITGLLCILLQSGKKTNSSLNHVLDSLMIYAFENGALTCVATIVSMICWLTMPSNLIFLGIHFVISKLYANSLLATLNARKQLTQGRSARVSVSGDVPVVFSHNFRASKNPSRRVSVSQSDPF
ncbi:hypothetical protein BD779DRAFT_1536296 [Infundibulicybe gibba]|nr:hypothetical protein BD779DRAFT_1536296 [Infundibulicybe gibba]